MESLGQRVLETKSHPPTHPSAILVRQRLWRRLDEIANDPSQPNLGLVTAPAGFGKTTLLSSWLPSMAGSGRPVAWCNLDDSDSDTFRFWSGVLAALKLSGEAISIKLKGLAAPHRPGNRDFFLDFMAAIQGEQAVLILENLHEVTDPHVLADLNHLLADPISDLVLILTSRSDPPLSALQGAKLAAGLVQIRANELAFDRSEVDRWCIDLSSEQARSIWEWTEGWPAMVRLMDVQVKAGVDVRTQLAGTDLGLADHLFQETFRRQSEEVQRTLLLASIPDAVPIDLAVALSGRSNAGQILEGVAQLTGLLTRTPDRDLGEPVYRIHPMLRAYLHGELLRVDRDAERTAQHVSAQWSFAAGLELRAAKHAVASRDSLFQEGMVRAVGPGLINAGRAGALLHVLDHSSRDDDQVWTALMRAAALLDVGRLDEASAQIHHLRQSLARVAERGEQLHKCADLGVAWEAVEMQLQRRQGAHVAASEVTSSSESKDLDLRLLLAAQRGPVSLWAGNLSAAEHELQIGISSARGLDRTAALIDCLAHMGGVHASRSENDALLACVDEALELGAAHGWGDSPRMAYPHLLRGWAAYQQLDHELANFHVSRAETLLEPHADPLTQLAVEAIATALHSHGLDSPAANADHLHQVFCQVAKLLAPPVILVHLALMDVAMSLAALRARHVPEVLEVLQTRFGYCAEVPLIEAMAKYAGGHRAEAQKILTTALGGHQPFLVPLAKVEAFVLAATLAYRADEFFAATEWARKALNEAARLNGLAPLATGGEPFERLLRDNVGRWGVHEPLVCVVLNRAAQQQTQLPPLLTAREQDVLRELPNLNTVEEIAHALCVSPNTVKTHLRSLYRKLGVTSRRAAVAEARRLRFL